MLTVKKAFLVFCVLSLSPNTVNLQMAQISTDPIYCEWEPLAKVTATVTTISAGLG